MLSQTLETLPTTTLGTRELAFRAHDGVEVTLYWNEADDQLTVAVLDHKVDGAFVIRLENERPLDVFNHPYAYAAHRGVPYRVPQRGSDD